MLISKTAVSRDTLAAHVSTFRSGNDRMTRGLIRRSHCKALHSFEGPFSLRDVADTLCSLGTKKAAPKDRLVMYCV